MNAKPKLKRSKVKRSVDFLERIGGFCQKHKLLFLYLGVSVTFVVSSYFSFLSEKLNEQAAQEQQFRFENETKCKIRALERELADGLPHYVDLRDQFSVASHSPTFQSDFVATRIRLISVFREINESIALLADRLGQKPNFVLSGWRPPIPEHRGVSGTNVDGKEYVMFTSKLWDPLFEDFTLIIKEIYQQHRDRGLSVDLWPKEAKTLRELRVTSIGEYQYFTGWVAGSSESKTYSLQAKTGETHFLLPNNHDGKPIEW